MDDDVTWELNAVVIRQTAVCKSQPTVLGTES